MKWIVAVASLVLVGRLFAQSATEWNPELEAKGPKISVQSSRPLNLYADIGVFFDSIRRQNLQIIPASSYSDLCNKASTALAKSAANKREVDLMKDRVRSAVIATPEYKRLDDELGKAEKQKQEMLAANDPNWLGVASQAGQIIQKRDGLIFSAIKKDAALQLAIADANRSAELATELKNYRDRIASEASREIKLASEWLTGESLAIGVAGNAVFSRAFQILGRESVIISLPASIDDAITIQDGGSGNTMQALLTNKSTEGIVDGQALIISDPVVVTSTYKYNTAIGGTNTIYAMRPLTLMDVENYLVKIGAKLSVPCTRPSLAPHP